MSTLVQRRAAAAVLALAAATLSGGAPPAGAATTPVPPVIGQVRLSGARVDTSCDGNGRMLSRTVSVAYDGRDLTGFARSAVLHAVYTPPAGGNPGFYVSDAGSTPEQVVQAGQQGAITRTVAYPAPTTPRSGLDIFVVRLDDAAGSSGQTLVSVTAPQGCAGVTERTGPTVSVSVPRCDGTVDVTVDATGVTDDWTPTAQVAGRSFPLPLVRAGEQAVRTVDLGNLRAARVDVSLSSPGATAAYPDVVHGVTQGLTVPACTATTRGALVPVTPTRVLDTRSGTGAPTVAVAAGGRVVVATTPTVPTGATAVALNLTVTEARAAGYLQAWSSVGGPGTASVLNVTPGRTTSRSVIVPLDTLGRFALGNVTGGSVQLVADVTGYAVGDGAPAAGDLVPLEATRLLDTRTVGARLPVGPGETVHVPVVGKAGIGSASAVALQVTAVGGTSAGYLTTWSGTGTRPATSTVNYLRGQVVGALAPTAVAADGTVAVTNTSAGTVHLVVDVEGWWRAGTDVTTGGLRTLAPQRLLDTRTSGGALAPGASRTVDVLGDPASPGTRRHGVSAVLVNLTATEATAAGYLRAQPEGTPAAPSSSLNFLRGETVANHALVGVSDAGLVTVTNGSSGSTQVLVDLLAYVTR